jgi:hypothetical protein
MTARLWVAWVLCAGLAAPAAAQSQAPASQASTPVDPNETIRGTEVFNEFSWDRATNVSVDTQSIAFGDAPFHIVFSVTYKGLKLAVAPDILLVRDRPSASDVKPVDGETPLAVAIVDKLPVPLTKQTTDGPDRIMGVLTFEVFQWIVGGSTLDFEAFGRHFIVVPGQLAALKQAAGEWAHSTKH